MTLPQQYYRRLLSYFSPPSSEPHAAFPHSDQTIILVAAIFFQALYLLIIPLAFEGDAAMYFRYAKTFIGAEGGGGAYYRAPGFPFFLALSGQLLFSSFIPTVALHAVMGVLSPLLFYRTLAPLNRWAAFIAAVAFILSTTPFYGAKIMLPEQLFAFLIVAGFYGFSRYYFARDVRFPPSLPALFFRRHLHPLGGQPAPFHKCHCSLLHRPQEGAPSAPSGSGGGPVGRAGNGMVGGAQLCPKRRYVSFRQFPQLGRTTVLLDGLLGA